MTTPGPSRRAIRGRYLFPVDRPPIRDGVLVVDGDRIVEICERTALPVEDLGNVAILPGLVNAHTHLEFSLIDAPLAAGPTFADWIRRVVGYRRGMMSGSGNVAAAVEQGLRESQAAGVRTLGEIATPGWPREIFDAATLDVTVFAELLGLGQGRIEGNLQLAREHSSFAKSAAPWHAGLSPHAPYTVHRELFTRAVELARLEHLPLAFHLAETLEELELLAEGTGPLRALLEEFGVWDPGAILPGTRPLDYLRPLALVERSLIIHGNFLNDEEIAFVAGHRDRMTVVYCPRTHQHFGHSSHPLEKLLTAGASMALGTDSRASNPDLNLLEEIRTVVRRHPGVSPEQALWMGTLGGAKALGLAHVTGTLSAGKRADWMSVPLSHPHAADPHELLL